MLRLRVDHNVRHVCSLSILHQERPKAKTSP